jgi:hypothetical protein
MFALVVEHRGPEKQQDAREEDGEMRHPFEPLAFLGAAWMRSMVARPSSRARISA